jgi:hypothetical protein
LLAQAGESYFLFSDEIAVNRKLTGGNAEGLGCTGESWDARPEAELNGRTPKTAGSGLAGSADGTRPGESRESGRKQSQRETATDESRRQAP